MLCWLPLPKAGERLLQLTERQVKYYVFLYFIDSVKSFDGSLAQPLPQRCPDGVRLANKIMLLEGETAPSWWGCLCACV
jgi:hypothetical protein